MIMIAGVGAAGAHAEESIISAQISADANDFEHIGRKHLACAV